MFFYVFMESIFLVGLVYLIFLILFISNDNYFDMLVSYECGFDSSCLTRLIFSYRFFLISILFIVFDVEVSLMIPIPYLMASLMGVFVFLMFIFVLIFGLMYEYFYGSLEWLCFYGFVE